MTLEINLISKVMLSSLAYSSFDELSKHKVFPGMPAGLVGGDDAVDCERDARTPVVRACVPVAKGWKFSVDVMA